MLWGLIFEHIKLSRRATSFHGVVLEILNKHPLLEISRNLWPTGSHSFSAQSLRRTSNMRGNSPVLYDSSYLRILLVCTLEPRTLTNRRENFILIYATDRNIQQGDKHEKTERQITISLRAAVLPSMQAELSEPASFMTRINIHMLPAVLTSRRKHTECTQ